MHLTPAQLDLAIEFNQGARIERRITHVHGEKQGTVPVHGTTEERKSPTRIPKTRYIPGISGTGYRVHGPAGSYRAMLYGKELSR